MCGSGVLWLLLLEMVVWYLFCLIGFVWLLINFTQEAFEVGHV